MESYLLAWYFAATYVKTDAFEKRGEKGFLFTIGDEPCLTNLPKSAIDEIFPSGGQSSFSDTDLLRMAQEKFNVYHIHVNHIGYNNHVAEKWKKLLGQKCVEVDDYRDIPKIVSEIVIANSKHVPNQDSTPFTVEPDNNTSGTSTNFML